MRRLLIMAFCLILVGCQKYSDNEKLNYLDDSEELTKTFRTILDVDRHKFGVLGSTSDIGTVLDNAMDIYKRKYQGTDVDKDFDLLRRLKLARDYTTTYMLCAGTFQDKKLDVKMPRQMQTSASQDEEDFRTSKKTLEDQLAEIEEIIKNAR